MPELIPVGTTTQTFSPAPITDEEGAAMFRACLSLFRLWGVSDI